MARRSILPSTVGQLPDPLPIETDKDGKLTTQSVGALNAFMQNYAHGFNGLVSMGDGRQSSGAAGAVLRTAVLPGAPLQRAVAAAVS